MEEQTSPDSGSRRYRESVADLRRALNQRQAPLLSTASRGSWTSFFEGCLNQFNSLLTAAICYVAAIAWMQVTYGEIGLLNRKTSSGNSTIASESRPLVGTDLVSFFFALIFVTGGCFFGVYKLQKMKHRAVAAELDRISALMEANGARRSSSSDRDGSGSDILQANIPAFSKLSKPVVEAGSGDSIEVEHASMYRELVVRKFRAEGMQKGTNMITDAWTFANMKMMTIFMRSIFVSAKQDSPGDKELLQVWIYTGFLLLACVLLVAATWEYPPRLIASSRKGFSTDRRARVELVAKNWSGGCAWLLAMQCIDTFEFTLAHVVLGRGHWHPWGNPADAHVQYSRGTSLNDWWLWLLSFVVFLVTSAVVMAIDGKKKPIDANVTEGIQGACNGMCCMCSLVSKHSDKVISFIGNALVWTGALGLKRALDTTVGLHGGIYRSCCDGCVYDGHPDCLQHYVAPPQPSDYYIPPPENRELKGFIYAAAVLFAALFAGMLIDSRGSYLLNRALAAADQDVDRTQVNVAKLWSARYYFFERWSKTLQKCLTYTSASQTSNAVVIALGTFTEDHYWMYAMASTTIGVLFSILLTNQCTLGKGAPTCKDFSRAARMLCVDDCCCGGRRRGTRAPLLDRDHSGAASRLDSSTQLGAQRVSINSADDTNDSDAQHDMSRSRRVSDASDGPDSTDDEVVAANTRLRAQNDALTEALQTKARECEALRLRVAELEQQLDQRTQEQVQQSSGTRMPGGSE